MAFSTLISVEELASLHPTCILIDCRYSLADPTSGYASYLKGHLPKAYYADLEIDLSSPITNTSGRHPLPDFDALITKLQEWGVNDATQVVAYDDVSGSFASRLWWLLRALGHNNIAVLDGGIQAWQAKGLSLERTIPSGLDRSNLIFSGVVNSSHWWDTSALQDHLDAKDCVLIDARAEARFTGKQEPIDPIAGHIPGAVNLPVTDNINAAGCFHDAAVIRKRYQILIGSTPTTSVVHSCGSGVFACLGILAMEYAGLKGSKLYPGSWSEWIRDPAREVISV